jgi:hypothetical protein
MAFERTVRLIGFTAAVAGTTLAIDGPTSVVAFLSWLLSHAGVIVLGIAVVGLVRNIGPRGSLVGPLVLGAGGLAAAMLHERWWPTIGGWSVAGVGIAAAGGLMIMGREGPRARCRVR